MHLRLQRIHLHLQGCNERRRLPQTPFKRLQADAIGGDKVLCGNLHRGIEPALAALKHRVLGVRGVEESHARRPAGDVEVSAAYRRRSRDERREQTQRAEAELARHHQAGSLGIGRSTQPLFHREIPHSAGMPWVSCETMVWSQSRGAASTHSSSSRWRCSTWRWRRARWRCSTSIGARCLTHVDRAAAVRTAVAAGSALILPPPAARAAGLPPGPANPRVAASIDSWAAIPVWPAWPTPSSPTGGRVRPVTPDPYAANPFLLLAHHKHSFSPGDPIRGPFKTIGEALGLPYVGDEGFKLHPHRGIDIFTIVLHGSDGFRHTRIPWAAIAPIEAAAANSCADCECGATHVN